MIENKKVPPAFRTYPFVALSVVKQDGMWYNVSIPFDMKTGEVGKPEVTATGVERLIAEENFKLDAVNKIFSRN